jgi:sigma-E factor negative regulatory protein RseA
MEKISQLMDGELDASETDVQVGRLKGGAQLRERWDTYHLIRDALRDEVDVGPAFMRRLHERLEQEPVVLAPRPRQSQRSAPSQRLMRYTLPMAAGLAGIVVVGWLALSGAPGPQQPLASESQAQTRKVQTVAQSPARPAAPPPSANGGMSDYLVAHQEFSPSTAMQGVASYVRTVSLDEPPAGK